MVMPLGTIWTDLGAPLILAVAGAAIATFWPWLQTYWRGVKFQNIIKRELEEIGPIPAEPTSNTPWWRHLRKRFVHEEIFAREHISEDRDFLLSLDPDVVYKVSQLWAAYAERSATQWLHFLAALATDRRVGSPKLRSAYDDWKKVVPTAPDSPRPRTRDTEHVDPGGLFDARFAAYRSLAALTRYGPEAQPLRLSEKEREERADGLMNWFYECGGLLLSSEALVAFRLAHSRLEDPDATDDERRRVFSGLRTELKIDLGVLDADIRHIEMAALPKTSQPTR